MIRKALTILTLILAVLLVVSAVGCASVELRHVTGELSVSASMRPPPSIKNRRTHRAAVSVCETGSGSQAAAVFYYTSAPAQIQGK